MPTTRSEGTIACLAIIKAGKVKCRALVEEYGMEALVADYGIGGLPANIAVRLEQLKGSCIPAMCQEKVDKIVDAMDIACLAAWARGETSGPDTPEGLERRAKKADSLAKMFEKKGDNMGVKAQRRRAQQLRAQAATAASKKGESGGN